MLILKNLTYIHPDKELLFKDLNLSVPEQGKFALVGNNGSGKSTLLKIIAARLQQASGEVHVSGSLYYIPQVYGQFNDLTVAEALGVAGKIRALEHILEGKGLPGDWDILDDDWTISERCANALHRWGLNGLKLDDNMNSLSGGQKTRVFLSGIMVHQPDLILMDEPSNHLDTAGREVLYDFIRTTSAAMLIVSHDRILLNLLNTVCELSERGITVYGGNYDFYSVQKESETDALNHDIQAAEKALRKAREKERETLERMQRSDVRGKKKQEQSGVARIMMNTLRNNAENSTSKIRNVHSEKISGISQDLRELRAGVSDTGKMKLGFSDSALHCGKVLFSASDINFGYAGGSLWPEPLSFRIVSGDRLVLKGLNGSGKTTLIRIILGELEPQAGRVTRAVRRSVYIDQDYSLIDNRLTVYEQVQNFNSSGLQEHDVKIRLSRFLFGKEDWNKSCSSLSGGERMRLMLCCLTVGKEAPDMIILDEPTNNLDIQNTEILTAAIEHYHGTLVVVSHDQLFLESIHADCIIALK